MAHALENSDAELHLQSHRGGCFAILDRRSMIIGGTPIEKLVKSNRISSDMKEMLDRLTRELDPVALPDSFFDPTEPRLIGHFVALALIAQDRRPLVGCTNMDLATE